MSPPEKSTSPRSSTPPLLQSTPACTQTTPTHMQTSGHIDESQKEEEEPLCLVDLKGLTVSTSIPLNLVDVPDPSCNAPLTSTENLDQCAESESQERQVKKSNIWLGLVLKGGSITLLSVLVLCLGAGYLNECKCTIGIPIFMMGSGVLGLVACAVYVFCVLKKVKKDISKRLKKSILIVAFLLFIGGQVSVYGYMPSHVERNCCHNVLFHSSFGFILFLYFAIANEVCKSWKKFMGNREEGEDTSDHAD